MKRYRVRHLYTRKFMGHVLAVNWADAVNEACRMYGMFVTCDLAE